MISDQQERERALDPSQSFIVEAPAGSGKTGLLVQRFLRLLSTVDRAESVVAITFTRKAAAEMRERIHVALLEAAHGNVVTDEHAQRTRDLARKALEQDQKKDWLLLSDPGRLQIQTIDSLCALLTRQMPVVSEFGGIDKVIEDAGELYRLAARRMLRELAEGEAVQRSLLHRISLYFDNDIAAVERQVASMLERRDQWFHLEQIEGDRLVKDFCSLLERARNSLRTVFRERGVVDFTEVTRAAIRALGPPDRPSDLLYRLDYRIEHLLVDEFQDTSRAQYDLIDALTSQWSAGDGHTLFLVGDPMQSIYRFRGAEVSLFLKCLRDRTLGSVQLELVRLNTNFRSTPDILSWVEEHFSRVMLEDDPAEGAVSFRTSFAARENRELRPELIPFIQDDGQQEAREIVRILSEIDEKGKAAILVRSRTHIVAILPALRAAGIAYEAIEIDELKEQQHILDLLSLTRAILHLGDRVSWLACLRAPWCGLSLHDLSALAEQEQERTILDLLSDAAVIQRLSPDGRMRAVCVQEILSQAVESAGRMPLRDLIERTWLALGGPAVLEGTNQREDVETLLNLVEEFETGGFIRDFSLLSQRLERLYAKPKLSGDCVKVMTIFEAKGLEFDTVILPKLDKGTRSSDRELLAWTEHIDEEGLLNVKIAAQPRRSEQSAAYDEINEDLKKRDRHELKRLFYVACTRARNRLYLLASSKTKSKGMECSIPGDGTFLRLLWESAQAEFESALRRRVAAIASSENASPVTILRRLPANWRSPQFEKSIEWQPEFERSAASVREISYEWVSGTGRHAGTVVHELLVRIAKEGAKNWGAERIAASRKLIASELARLGVASSEQTQAVDRVIRALSMTLESERGRWILQAHPEARSEWAIGGLIGDKLVTGTIDRLFRDEEKRLWIIDFKTSEHLGARLEGFLNREQQRYRPQLESYATLVSRLLPGPVWLGLYFPLLDGWREWQFEKEAAVTV